MDEETSFIRLAGIGGQGVVLAGLLLGHAAVCDGFNAAGSNSYGSQSRGGLCTAEIIISRTPIDYPRVELASILIAMSQEGYDACADRLKPEGIILYDTGLVAELSLSRKHKGFDVAALSTGELGDRQASNLLWTGILAGSTGLVSQTGLERAIRTHIPEHLIESSLHTLVVGVTIGKRSLG